MVELPIQKVTSQWNSSFTSSLNKWTTLTRPGIMVLMEKGSTSFTKSWVKLPNARPNCREPTVTSAGRSTARCARISPEGMEMLPTMISWYTTWMVLLLNLKLYRLGLRTFMLADSDAFTEFAVNGFVASTVTPVNLTSVRVISGSLNLKIVWLRVRIATASTINGGPNHLQQNRNRNFGDRFRYQFMNPFSDSTVAIVKLRFPAAPMLD